VRNYNVVKGRVLLAEACEAYPDNHLVLATASSRWTAEVGDSFEGAAEDEPLQGSVDT
jgi:hypothetical protein